MGWAGGKFNYFGGENNLRIHLPRLVTHLLLQSVCSKWIFNMQERKTLVYTMVSARSGASHAANILATVVEYTKAVFGKVRYLPTPPSYLNNFPGDDDSNLE